MMARASHRFTSAVALGLLAGATAAFGCSSDESAPAPSGATGGGSSTASGGSSTASGGSSTASGGSSTASGGSSGGEPSGESSAPSSVALNEVFGRIDIDVKPPSDSAAGALTFIGKIYAAPYPSANKWSTGAEDGDCTLLLPLYPFCDPGCSGSEVCVNDGECVAYPALVNVGRLAVDGVDHTRSGTLEIAPLSEKNLVYQPLASAGLAYPGVAPGRPVVVRASGGAAGAFRVEAPGIDPLVATQSDLRLERDTAAELAWTAPTAAGASRVLVELDISHHGGVKGQIVCDAPDSGELVIPAELVTALLDLGVAGFPTVILTRRSLSTVETGYGAVALVINSRVELPVEIPGLISCSTDADCPDGQTCQQDKQCG